MHSARVFALSALLSGCALLFSPVSDDAGPAAPIPIVDYRFSALANGATTVPNSGSLAQKAYDLRLISTAAGTVAEGRLNCSGTEICAATAELNAILAAPSLASCLASDRFSIVAWFRAASAQPGEPVGDPEHEILSIRDDSIAIMKFGISALLDSPSFYYNVAFRDGAKTIFPMTQAMNLKVPMVVEHFVALTFDNGIARLQVDDAEPVFEDTGFSYSSLKTVKKLKFVSFDDPRDAWEGTVQRFSTYCEALSEMQIDALRVQGPD